jgi:hypothetical protein
MLAALWVELSLAAGCVRTLRNALARSLSRGVPPSLNGRARFAFDLPFAALLALGLWREREGLAAW